MISLSVRSQSGRLYTSDVNLSSSLINKVYQDSKGYIWIATEDGLNRYDGTRFIIYRQKKNDPASLYNNYIKSIFEDKNKNLFFGFINGLQIFNHATDSFREVSLVDNQNKKIKAHVSCIMQRKNGDVLIGTSGYGIFIMNIKKSKTIAKTIDFSILTGTIHDLFEDKNQNLWIVTQDKGVWRIDKNHRRTQFFNSKEHLANISSICEDKSGNIYVGSLNSGFYIYNKHNQKFDLIATPFPLPIKKLVLEKNNKILIGTDGAGLHIYDPVNKKITIANFNVSTFDFSMSKVHSVLEDKDGNLWVGLYQKGVLLLPPKENNFNYLGFQSVNNNVIGSGCVMSVFMNKTGILWVGTDGDGLYGITADNKRKYHYGFEKNGFGRLTILCVFEDSNNDLWVGTYLHGLAKLNPNTNNFEFINGLIDAKNKPAEIIFSIIEDNNKQLWIGSLGAGLYSLDLKTLKVTNNDSNPKDATNFLGNRYINCLLLNNNNKLYIGTYDGLYCFDIKTKTYTKWRGENHILSEKIIYALNEDKLGNLWIGSSEGLISQPKNGQKATIYTIDDNLPSNIICAIERDRNNNLWISTNHGISKFNLQTKKFFNFYFNDGLQGNEFSKNASFLDIKGQIIFGGMKGVTYFSPEKIKDNGKSINVFITGIYIQDKSVKKGMKSGRFEAIDRALIDAKTVDLSHDDNSFSIEFSTMDFNNQQHITYSYSLGNDKWIKLQQGANNVTFDNLEPGEYNFQVKAEAYGKYSAIRKLDIIIHPVWYFSDVAKCFYFVLFFVILYFANKEVKKIEMIQKKMREHLQNKKINEAKLQFLTNIAHDIKSPISLVINPLMRLMNSDEDSVRQKSYKVMYRNSERILQLVNQVMDVRKIDKGQISLNYKKTEIIRFIQELCLLFEDQIQSKNIQLQLHHEKPYLYAWVDPKYFDKVIQNVLSNAVKFVQEGGKIDVYIEEEKHNQDIQNKSKSNFVVTIVDNGIGVDKKEIGKIFDRFYQATTNKVQQSEGTGIGLHLTKSIVALHKGSIKADNNFEGPGCRFIINIPIGDEHQKEEIIEETKDEVDTHSFAFVEPVASLEEQEEQLKIYNSSHNKRKLLVVDDNDEIREYIYKELSTHYKVLTSSNGKDALDVVLKEPLDLIISDVKMPKMDGVTFCRKVKKNININHIPLILLTASSHQHDQLEGLNIGADAYITKPFNMEILKKTIINLIRTRELLKNNYSGNQAQEDKIKKITMESADEKLIKKIMNFINENLSNPDLNVEMIAAEIGISRVHLHRKLKELTSQSTRDLIRNVRLKQAGELLAAKQTNISQVAYLVGFSNISKFSTSFKQFYGVSPKTYMEDNLKKNDSDEN
jgi:ligand-binding sensor domain-containing protein/signal transduction histidine kinase/DNA-binding response OmpR family regulator